VTRILVVEDSPTQAEQLRFTLEEDGFTVEMAADAEQALDLVDRQSVDLVVSDIVLPGASGFDLCSELKRRRSDLPVLMLSSLNDPMTIIRSLESGADYFLTKPYGPEHLTARIRTALSTGRARRARGSDGAVEVIFRGKRFTIQSQKEQMLDLLLSTFEDVFRTNEDLEKSRAELAAAKRELERHAGGLEQLVDDRTAELMDRQEQLALAQKVARMGDWKLDVRAWSMSRSDSMCAVMGTSRSTEDFDEALERVHEEDRARVRSAIERAIGDKTGFSLEARVIAPGGGERFIWFIGQPKLDSEGNVEEFFGTAQDITARKRMELSLLEAKDQLYKAQKLEAVGQLTGGMAHDFNNLLAIIIGNLDLAREDASDPQLLQPIEEALAAALRGAELNQRLLAFARRQALQPHSTDVNELVTDTAKLLERVLGERVAVTLDLAADLAPAFVDPSQLESAITNLAINARDAMPGGGEISIRTGNKLVGNGSPQPASLPRGDYVVIEVADTGIGMDRDLVARVCEPFFTTKPVGKGTGLGLSMVSGFLAQSGGELAIDSVPGEGTTMSLYLPTATGADCGLPKADSETGEAADESCTVLVVEDNDSLRSVILRQLQSLGYSTIETGSADEAMEVIAKRNDVDVLFTDVVMPGRMDGNALVRQARKIRPDLKIIVSSGFRGESSGSEFDEPGIVILNKPYKKAALARTLSQLCQSPHS
jgi:PAS domain S-box-containing protein